MKVHTCTCTCIMYTCKCILDPNALVQFCGEWVVYGEPVTHVLLHILHAHTAQLLHTQSCTGTCVHVHAGFHTGGGGGEISLP